MAARAEERPRAVRAARVIAALAGALLPAVWFATTPAGAATLPHPSPAWCGYYTEGLSAPTTVPQTLSLVDTFPAPDVAKWGGQPFRNPAAVSPTDKNNPYLLTVEYTKPTNGIWPSINGCPLKVRSYNGKLVGPTLVARPGDTLYIDLHNALPPEDTSQRLADVNQEVTQTGTSVGMVPNAFNVTNLHTHGLHVSPSSSCPSGRPHCDPAANPCLQASDNVLLTIQPGETCHYVIHVPRNHPSGTFWYHAHVHGSTALQVASGMEGALIIEDRPGSMPSWLAAATAHQKVFVIQTIPFEPSQDADWTVARPERDSGQRQRHRPGRGRSRVQPRRLPGLLPDRLAGPRDDQRAARSGDHGAARGSSAMALHRRRIPRVDPSRARVLDGSTAGARRDRARRPVHRPRRYLGRQPAGEGM